MEDAPTTVVDSLPAGSNSLYLFFDYENLSHNNIFELRVTIDGLPNQTFSLAPVQWSGGRNGLWYIGTSGQPLPNGKVYEFRLFIDGIVAGNRRLVVGGAAEPRPTLSSIAFGLLDLQGNILGNGYVLPTGNIATARFIYQNMVDGLEWTAIWYFNNAEVYRNADVWSDSESGTKDISIQDSNGLLPGNYRLELYLEDRLAATSDFSIAGAQLGALPQVFSNLYFTSAASVEDALIVSPIGNFPNRVDTLYVLFDWQQLTSGTLWTMRWSVDGQVFFEQTQPWDGPVSGEQFLTTLTGTRGIPDGNYQVDLLLKNRMLASATAEVGIGQLSIDRFAQAGGIQMIGRVVDSETGAGIPGIAFVLLSEDFSVEDFTWQQDQIFALSVTDSAGRFQVDRPLQPEVLYSVVVAADGYLPITQDGVLITGTEDNPLELTIYLTRD
jgi:hypothetical protein